MNFFQWLIGDCSSIKPKKPANGAISPKGTTTREAQDIFWGFLSALPSEKATCAIYHRSGHFAVSRDRVVRGIKLREISESEYLASRVDLSGRPSFDRVCLHREFWKKNYHGRVLVNSLLIKNICKLADPSGLLARIWNDCSDCGGLFISEHASGKWAIWEGFEPPDDSVQSKTAQLPPQIMETPFMLANEDALLPEVRYNRVLDCLPLIRTDRRIRDGGFDPEDITEVLRSLVLGGRTPAAFMNIYKSETVTPYRADGVFATPHMIRIGPNIWDYAQEGSSEFGGFEVKKATNGMWWICRNIAPEPR